MNSNDVMFLVREDEQLVEMTAQPYESEPVLQEYLAKYPDLLAGGQIDPENPRRWLLVSREMGIPWEEDGGNMLSVDHLFLDQDGVPTLVEVKRSSDTRIRREVVGQMLEYAANAVTYWPVERIRSQFEVTCEKQQLNAHLVLAEFVQDAESEDFDEEQFWQQVKTNMQIGRIRMIFVADEIPFQLRRMVEFLNEQMAQAEVLAVEVKQYVGQGLRTLAPRLVGQTAQAQQRKGAVVSEGKQWDEKLFFEVLSRHTDAAGLETAHKILDRAKTHMPNIYWGKGKEMGSFTPGLSCQDSWYQLIGVWTYGSVELQFQYMKSRGSLDDGQRLDLLHRINAALGTALADVHADRRPNVPLAVVAKEGVLAKFLDTLEWALQQIVSDSGQALGSG